MASKLSSFFAELKRRKVYHVAVAYILVGWGVSQGAEFIFGDVLGLQDVVWQVVIGLVVLGFPIALVLAWAYEVRPEEPEHVESPPVPTKETQHKEDRKSIVVLPFDNMSPDPRDVYFADGLTEEIITTLSRIRSLRVISRNSAMVLKGTRKSTGAIAEELKVQYVLEGSVRKVGNDLRITAQLIDAGEDEHLWSETYNGVLEDVFDMQEHVSRSIVGALEIRLTSEEEGQIHERRINDIPAYECFLKASGEMWHSTAEAMGRAIRYLEDAIEIIGPNPYLYAGMAYAHWQRVNLGFAQDEAIDLAETYVSRALELEPDFPPALAIRGAVELAHRADLQRSMNSLKRALAADPNDTMALVFLAATLLCQGGKPEAARPLIERVAEIDPLSYPTHWLRGALPFFQGEYESASVAWGRLHDMTPGNPMYEFYYALALAYGGNRDRALEVLRGPESTEAEDVAARFCHMLRCALLDDAPGVLNQLTPEFRQTASRDPEWAYHVAARLALVHHETEALEWLGYAMDAGFINYPMLADHDPFLAKLRCNPRYEALLKEAKERWEAFEI